jgi:ATP-dependent RNA helicase HelY
MLETSKQIKTDKHSQPTGYKSDHQGNRKRFRRKSHHTPGKQHQRMRPQAEPVLNGVFARIGRPEGTPFRPDAFQLEALACIQRTDCLVAAPTGSGKTWIAEQAIKAIFEKGGRCWYASPLKALTNAKLV